MTIESNKAQEFNIGRDIRVLRLILGLSQGQLAKLSGLTPSSISLIESGQRDPGIKTVKKICKALDICPSYFFRDHAKKESPIEVLHSNLSDEDKNIIEKFSQFLAYSKNI